MAKIYPFRAVRPTHDKVSLVTARSYGDYSTAELAAQLAYNPLSFLHVLNPAYNDPQKSTTEKRFRKVQQKYKQFKNENVLVRDEKPSVYIHKIVTPTNVFTGIIAATSVEDYKTDVIKRHEDTIHYRVEWLKDYIKFAGFNTEPVLMTYKDNEAMEKWLSAKMKKEPEFEFSTTKHDLHFLWKIDDQAEIETLQAMFESIGNLYIADGHHRCASAEMLYDENGSRSDSRNQFMSFLIADSNVRIYEFNRLIRTINGLSKEKLFDDLSADFNIDPKGAAVYHPQQKHEFAMYIENEFYSLTLHGDKRNFKSVIDSLDTQILYDKILLPILGIEDLRNEDRIEYIPGNMPVSRLVSSVDDGEYELAFILYPSDINEIKAIADAHLIMPPKSTYIEPKFRSGLVVYEL